MRISGSGGPKLHTGTPRGTKQYIDRGELVRRLLRPPPTPPPGVGTGTPKTGTPKSAKKHDAERLFRDFHVNFEKIFSKINFILENIPKNYSPRRRVSSLATYACAQHSPPREWPPHLDSPFNKGQERASLGEEWNIIWWHIQNQC